MNTPTDGRPRNYTPLRAKQAQLVEAALSYAWMGVRVIPVYSLNVKRCACRSRYCEAPGKHPILKGWLDAGTTDPALIVEWWTTWPAANIGVLPGRGSRLVILDEDPRNGGDLSLARLRRRGCKVPETATVMSGGGGRHFWLRHPDEDVPWSKCVKDPGIDILADGRMVVAPPSIHWSGERYRWLRRPEHGIADAPGWMLPPVLEGEISLPEDWGPAEGAALVVPAAPAVPVPVQVREGEGTAYGKAALASEARAVRTAPVGERNQTLYLSSLKCGSLVSAGQLSRSLAETVLVEAGLATGMHPRKVKNTVARGLDTGMKSPRRIPSWGPSPTPPSGA
jgi:hypothetical protein